MTSLPLAEAPEASPHPEATRPLEVLRQVFGYPAFRGPQEAVVERVLAGGSALVLMPTGGGKSLCWQVPALCMEGLTVVITPLIALMDDQVEGLRQLGVAAAALHSALPPEEAATTWADLAQGRLKLLYISPERLLSGDGLQRLASLPLALFAIDEAHCLSQWGHDFRPDYLQLSQLAERFPSVPRLALTATADPRTRDDIAQHLRLPPEAVFVASFNRANIRYWVRPKDEPRQQLLAFLAEHRGEAGIVDARSRKRVEQVAELLQGAGIDAMAYHAGLDPERRTAVLRRFRGGGPVVVVATIAFGMGINRPDVRFVAHIDLPKSLEAYYQETGRAGRDGLPALAWMIHGGGDGQQLRQWIEESSASEEQKRIERGKLDALIGFAETATCRRQVLLAHLGEPLAEPCGNCDSCLDPQQGVDVTEPARKALSAVHRTGCRFGAAHLVEVLVGADTARIKELGHQTLSVYGVGKELDRGQWRGLFRQLVSLGYLVSDPEARGGLRFGPETLVRPLLRGETSLSLPLQPPGRDRHSSRARNTAAMAAAGGGATEPSEEETARFTQLKRWRLEQARQQGVPPYVVFHDRTLLEIASRQPSTLDELASVGGVGRAKLDRYGPDLLEQLARMANLSPPSE
ncbi:MAG: DNA helicase RecQ [Cyanobacteriota bacterium]|nr:DNA helicase RecQ [Cyanobacteriota bacterium]